MPQFESQYFVSQIFWFLVCFIIIYIAVSRVYIPKISNLIKKREEKHKREELMLKKTEDELNSIKQINEQERLKLSKSYNQIIKEARDTASRNRSNELSKFAKKSKEMSDELENSVKKFHEEYKDYSLRLTSIVKQKILNKLG